MNPPDPARRNRDAHRAILDAAWAVLESQGWDGVTVDRIAAAAGVGKQTVYRWWRGKADVVFEAFLEQARAHLPPRRAGRSLPELLRENARNFVRLYVDAPLGAHLRELLGAAQRDPQLAEAMREHWFLPRREPLRQALDEARRGHSVRDDIDTDTLLDLLFGPLHYRLLTGHAPVDRRFADDLVTLTLAAIAPAADEGDEG
jgi:AcrR family transcriptional regulator